MTNEEIKKIESAINFVDYCTPAETNEDVELAGIAIEALEKQVPKKVKKEFVTVNGCITCFETDVCPVCGNDFYIEDLGQTMYYSFCPDCGQALDWGENNE